MKRLLSILAFFVFALCVSHEAQGQVVINGGVYEQDSITPIVGATVIFSGIDMEGDTLTYYFVTDTLGLYGDSINFGSYWVSACALGYECACLMDSLTIEIDSLYLECDTVIMVSSMVLYEICYPVSYLNACYYTENYVQLNWSMYNPEEDDDTLRANMAGRSFRYFDLCRQPQFGDPEPLVSHLTDTMFMDMHWHSLPWGRYRWGVCCYYEGNRGVSDTIWSVFLDKDMTTTLEVHVTTNVGLPAAGAVAELSSYNGQGNSYQATANNNGFLVFPDVYRDAYIIHVHLNGFEDYVSDTAFSVMMPTQMDVELLEEIHSIDSLYISGTGWATWTLAEEGSRGFQYYELMLNDVLVNRLINNAYQFNVSQLNAGDTCMVQVRPVYLSGAGPWYSKEWVYQSCAAFSGSAEGLQWTLDEEGVLLHWDYPVGDSILGTYLYRDGEYVAFLEDNMFLDEAVTFHGELEYGIQLLHGNPSNGSYNAVSCMEYLTVVFPVYCDPPMKLEGENYLNGANDYGALISWGERPPVINEWLQYDDGTFKRALGGDDEPIIFWSIRFDTDDLTEYGDCTLQKVSLFDVGAGTYQLWIYMGGDTAPRSLLWSQNMVLNNAHAWHEERLGMDIVIPENEPIWIVVGQQGLNRPAAACVDMGNSNGRWVSLDGDTWTDMHNYNMNYTWMLRAFVTNTSGRQIALGEDFELQHYNLYRSYDNINYQKIATILPAEDQEFYQYYDVLVGEAHTMFYYRLTASYLSDEGDTCESDYAASLYEPDLQYVLVDDHWSVPVCPKEGLRIYPNPADDRLFVEADDMVSLSVFNTFGQCVLKRECQDDTMSVNLSGFSLGVYFLKIDTKNGVFTKRFVVSH